MSEPCRSRPARLAAQLIAAVALLAAATGAHADPLFANRMAEQPFTHSYTGGWEHFVGGGVAVLDCNDDGYPDIFAAGGEQKSSLLVNRTGSVGGRLRFEPAETPPNTGTGVTGAYPLDIDGDGITDLAVLRVGENVLLKGKGECRFAPANDLWGFNGGDRWTTAFSATFEKGHRMPTLAFGNYVDRDDPNGPFFACDDNRLYRSEDDRYAAPIALSPGYCALSMLFTDWARKGRQDLRVSNDRHYYVRGGQEQLWRLAETPRLYGDEDGWKPFSIWGMGIASRDVTGDGLPEVFLTSMGDQKLQFLDKDAKTPSYHDATYARGTTAQRPYVGDEGRPSSGWHAAFADVDNDGLDDLFIAKGNVDQMPDSAMRDPNNLLMQQPDGTFREFGDKVGLASPERSRGAAVVDLNRDGKLDVVVNNRRAALELNENVSDKLGHWLAVRLRQDGPNVDAIGAWIELSAGKRKWYREITVGGGHAGGDLGYRHFGTGKATDLELRVTWPDGEVSGWRKVAADRHLQVTRDGAGLKIEPDTR